jgi:hypothetical protein
MKATVSVRTPWAPWIRTPPELPKNGGTAGRRDALDGLITAHATEPL